MIDDLTWYFLRTYIRGEKIGRIRGEPQYPLALWYHNKGAAEGLARTTSSVEGWHLGVTSLFQGNHPGIWTFLEKISLDAANQKFNIKSLSVKENKSRKKYRVLNENVKNFQNWYCPIFTFTCLLYSFLSFYTCYMCVWWCYWINFL